MSRVGACPCGAVRFTVDGPVRDVIVCHCNACVEVEGRPFAASSAWREHLVIADPESVEWHRAAVSEYGASRGFCRRCGSYVFWDGPELPTVSFRADALADAGDLEVVAHIWVPEPEREAIAATGVSVAPEGSPAGLRPGWH